MSDPLDAALARLAPEVDVPASRAVFERHRSRSGPPRWLLPAAVVALVVAGVVGLLVIDGDGDDGDVPVSPVATTVPVDRALHPGPGETITAGPDDFEVVLVAETTVGFGNAELVTSADELDRLWSEWDPGAEQPAVDFDGDLALVMTRPDDACADTIPRFDVSDADGVPLWTPVFEVPPGDCEAPLLSWLYVVTIDRGSFGPRAAIRVPAAEDFGVPEQLIEYTAPSDPSDGPDAGSGGDAAVTLTPTDIVLPLPPVGEPALHSTSLGLLWVIQHADGTVSVLPGTVDRPPDDATVPETVGVSMLQYIVQVSDRGDTLVAGPWTWDDHGRSTDADRSTDLVGFEGDVVGTEVAVSVSDANRIDGDPTPTDGGDSFPLDLVTQQLGQPMDLEIFPTLSSSGPVWRYFDGGLVVEGGVGRICDVDLSVPVEELDGCDAGGVVLDTLVTSDRPDATVWFGPPILAFQDPFRGFTHVIPLGGAAGRNDAIEQGIEKFAVTKLELVCGGPDGSLLLVRVGMDLPPGATFSLAVIDGGSELGRGSAGGSGETTVAFPLTAAPGPTAELLVTAGADEFARLRLPGTSALDCLPPVTLAPRSDGAPIERLVLGDSMTLGAAAELTDRGYVVDATVSRQLADVVPEVEELVGRGLIADEPVVIHLGNNGPIAQADLDRLLDTLDGFGDVILLTVHADRDWTEPNNTLILAAGERPNVTVIEWDELAGECPGECFMSDGIHLTDAGAQFYVDTIDAVAARGPD